MQRRDEAIALVGPTLSEDTASLEQARQQITQLPAGHPQAGPARQQIQAFEKDLEELKGVAKELGV